MSDGVKAEQRVEMPKTRKAIDWLCACLIRLPMVAVGAAVILGVIFFIAYMVAPDVAMSFLGLFGVHA